MVLQRDKNTEMAFAMINAGMMYLEHNDMLNEDECVEMAKMMAEKVSSYVFDACMEKDMFVAVKQIEELRAKISTEILEDKE